VKRNVSAGKACAFPDSGCFLVGVDSSLLRLESRRRFPLDLRQLAIRKEPTNHPDGDPPPATLLTRRFPQMPLLVGPCQHLHLHQLLVVLDVAHSRPLPLDKPRPAVPALDQHCVAGGVRNHEPGRVRTAAIQFPDVP